MNRVLFVFTAMFPYGQGIEVFLEDEIKYLSSSFDEVIIIPFSGDDGGNIRPLPSNCKCLKPILHHKKRQYLRALFGFIHLRPFLSDFISNRVFLSRVRLKNWLLTYIHVNCFFQSSQWAKIKDKIKSEDVFYFYWGRNINAISLFLCNKVKCVSRFHGEWDLWEESSDNYIPVRPALGKSLCLAVFISQRGENYFKHKYPSSVTFVSRLGSEDRGQGKHSRDGIIRVLSCSSVYALKRVPLIYQSLLAGNEKHIEWTHLGDGPDMEALRSFVRDNPSDYVSVSFPGWVSHEDVLRHYQCHPVDVFVNLSVNEGIPVSIMEAISFNVPVVATNVGSTSEIVNDRTGCLVSSDPLPLEVKDAILSVIKQDLNPRVEWGEKYNAKENYTRFANVLSTL